MLYIFLPKPDEASENWGFSPEELLAVVAPSGVVRRYRSGDFKAHLDGTSPLREFPQDAIACYSDYPASPKPYRNLIRSLLGMKHRVFRHFGEIQLAQLTLPQMRRQMSLVDDPYWEEDNIVPYTIRGGGDSEFEWLPIIREVRDGCFKNFDMEVTKALEMLESAWILARGYYDQRKPMRVLLESLFPLYLTLSGNASGQDKMAAIQAVGRSADRDVLRLYTSCIQSRMRRPAPKFLVNRDFKLLSSIADVEDFCVWFKKLSMEYTGLLGLEDASDIFAP